MAQAVYAEEILGQVTTMNQLGKGLAVVEAGRKLGSRNDLLIVKKECGGLRVDQPNAEGLEQEHVRLKRLVADLSLDNSILKRWQGKNGMRKNLPFMGVIVSPATGVIIARWVRCAWPHS